MSPGPSAVFLLAPVAGAVAMAYWPRIKTLISQRRARKARKENR